MRAQSPRDARHLNLGAGYAQYMCPTHENTVTEAKALSICSLRATKRFENVWPSFRRTQALNNHVCASLLTPQPLGSSTSADPASLAGVAVNIEVSRKKVVIGQYSTFNVCNIDVLYLTKTCIYWMSSI
jgi:hypothetical protein